MGDKKPLVITDGQPEQLQPGDELFEEAIETPFARVERLIGLLVYELKGQGFEIESDELIELLNKI